MRVFLNFQVVWVMSFILMAGCTKGHQVDSPATPPTPADLLSLDFPDQSHPSAITLDQLPQRGLYGLRSIQTLVITHDNVRVGVLHTFHEIGRPNHFVDGVTTQSSGFSNETHEELSSQWEIPQWIDALEWPILLRDPRSYSQVTRPRDETKWDSRMNKSGRQWGAGIFRSLGQWPTGKIYLGKDRYRVRVIGLYSGTELTIYAQYQMADATALAKFTYSLMNNISESFQEIKAKKSSLRVKQVRSKTSDDRILPEDESVDEDSRPNETL